MSNFSGLVLAGLAIEALAAAGSGFVTGLAGDGSSPTANTVIGTGFCRFGTVLGFCINTPVAMAR